MRTRPLPDYVTLPHDHAGFEAARFIAGASGCAKMKVGAVVLDRDGGILGAGNNDVVYNFRYCPRSVEGYKSGEGYEICHSTCGQNFHAEVAAVQHALKCNPAKALIGGTLFLWGHVYCCDSCLAVMRDAGIAHVALPVNMDTGLNPSIEPWA